MIICYQVHVTGEKDKELTKNLCESTSFTSLVNVDFEKLIIISSQSILISACNVFIQCCVHYTHDLECWC